MWIKLPDHLRDLERNIDGAQEMLLGLKQMVDSNIGGIINERICPIQLQQLLVAAIL